MTWSAGLGIGPLIQVSNAWSQCLGPQVTSRSSGPGPGQRGSSGTGAGPGYLGLGLQIRICRGASPAPEFVSICFKTRRERWLLDSTRFDSFRLFSTRLDSTLFDSFRLDSIRLFSSRFDSFRFDSTRSTQSLDLPAVFLILDSTRFDSFRLDLTLSDSIRFEAKRTATIWTFS